MTHSDNISEALFDLLMNASDKDRERLEAALGDFRTKAFRSYNDVKRKGGMLSGLLGAIEECEQFHKEMGSH